MGVEILVQEALVEGGLASVFYASFCIPATVYQDVEMNEMASARMLEIESRGDPGIFVHDYTVSPYGLQGFFVASPKKKLTLDLAEAILKGFKVDYVIRS
ncbi:hypothetical protein JW826_03585 [Candidatus Woesearchaeota archaeon]|nr:hypothetical protein [Candidatus Woesearchaeota archaeon]